MAAESVDRSTIADYLPFARRLPNVKVVTPLAALVVIAAAFVFALLPFHAANGRVSCEAALHGAKPTAGTPAILGGSAAACRDKGNSRLAVTETVAITAGVIAGIAVALPTRRETGRATPGLREA